MIALLNADGTPDPSFNAGVDGSPFAMALQADGKVVVTGTFAWVNGSVTRYFRARFFPDGSVDQSFSSTQDYLYGAAIVQTDGKLLLAAAGGLTRFNGDGSEDTSFRIAASVLYGLVQQADGKILLGGTFTTVNGVARTGLARIYNYPGRRRKSLA